MNIQPPLDPPDTSAAERTAAHIDAVVTELCSLAAFVDWVRPEISTEDDMRISRLVAAKDAAGVQAIYMKLCEQQAHVAIHQDMKLTGDHDASAAAERVLRYYRRETRTKFPISPTDRSQA